MRAIPPIPLSRRMRQKGKWERPRKRKAESRYHHLLSPGNGASNGGGVGTLSIPSSRPPQTPALLAAIESKLKANLGCWAKSFGLESQIGYLGVLTTGMHAVASIRLSVGEVSFLKERSTGGWKCLFLFGKGCYTKQQRYVPKTAHKSELKLHFQGHEIFTS